MAAILVMVLEGPASAQALQDQPPPQHRLVHKNTFALRFNPLGLLYEGRFVYRRRLYETDKLSLRDNFLGIGVAPTLSPAFVRIGPYVEVAPTSVLSLWAAFQLVRYFGSFDLLQSFPSPGSDFSEVEIARRGDLPSGDPRRPYASGGTELTIGADFQIKLWQVVVRSRARMVRPQMQLREGDTTVYDQFYDVLAPNLGWFFTNDFDALYQTEDKRLVAGLRYTATLPFYTARHFPDGEAPENPNRLHRVGLLAGWTFFNRDGAAFNSPTVFVLAQWWIQHRYRTGAVVSQAVPLMGIGFQMSGDFLPLR
ncbi:MAG: hypothetical protein ACT4TC_19900 [Myxococcaceae bacterium]